jgi:1-phosphofructokinase
VIATVTLNPAIDKTMLVPGFCIGGTNRGQVERLDYGGKGINVARAARHFGCSVSAFGFLAATDGRAISDELTAAGISNEFVYVPGETRVNLKIKDPTAGTETEINEPGFKVEPGHLRSLENKIGQNAGRCSVMVFSGSLPPGVPTSVYADFIGIARQCGARTILDAGGAALKKGIAARPDLVKPNLAETEELLGIHIRSEEDLLQASRELLALGPRMVVISLGKDGALAASAEKYWRGTPPSVQAESSIAAGDSMVGALAYAMVKNLAPAEAIRLAVAAGTATVAMRGSNVAGRDLIDQVLPRVFVEEQGQGFEIRK